MDQLTATIIANTLVAQGYYELEFTWEGTQPAPGQFVTIRLGDSTDPLLRRPFAFSAFATAQAPDEYARGRIIYERRGKATKALAAAPAGDSIDILGPLGKPFPTVNDRRAAILVAGGIGIGPIAFLAGWCANAGIEAVCIVGGQSADRIPLSTLESLGTTVIITTEDGSRGIHGNVLDGIATVPADLLARAVFYTCGPHAMMAAVAKEADAHGGDCWVSMEQVMGCGVGACMGCAIRVHGEEKYARVCSEGPVFHAKKIVW